MKDHVSFSVPSPYLLFFNLVICKINAKALKNSVTEYTLYLCFIILLNFPTFFFFFHLDPSIPNALPSSLPLLFSPQISLFSVFKGGLRHLWPLRQALCEHTDVVLWGPAHQPCDSQLPYWRRGSVHPAAPAVHQRGFAVTLGPLRLEPICFPLRHRQR